MTAASVSASNDGKNIVRDRLFCRLEVAPKNSPAAGHAPQSKVGGARGKLTVNR
jgi:hypothetical protein